MRLGAQSQNLKLPLPPINGDEAMTTAVGSKRPENCPVDSFQWRTGGSPGGKFVIAEVL